MPIRWPARTAARLPRRSKCTDCSEHLTDGPPISMKVRDMSQLMMVDQLLPFTARTSNTEEQTMFEQLFVPDYDAPDARAAQMRLLAERFSRSLLSFLAPLVALLGVCADQPHDQLVRAAAVLPGADVGRICCANG